MRCGCISASGSVFAWWRSCWRPAASLSATKPCGSGHANLASSSPTGSAGVRVVAGLSVPRPASRDAPSSNWKRSVQIRRIQTEPVDHSGQKPGLLEAGPAISRRHRVHDHQRSVDEDARLCRGQGRLALWRDDPANKGHQEPGAAGDLRDDCSKCQPQPAGQPR
jgi:hypothetical protein